MKGKRSFKNFVETKGARCGKRCGMDLRSGSESTIHHRYNETRSPARHGGEIRVCRKLPQKRTACVCLGVSGLSVRARMWRGGIQLELVFLHAGDKWFLHGAIAVWPRERGSERVEGRRSRWRRRSHRK